MSNGARIGNAMTYRLGARELLDFGSLRMKRLAADFFERKDRAFMGGGLSATLTLGLRAVGPSFVH